MFNRRVIIKSIGVFLVTFTMVAFATDYQVQVHIDRDRQQAAVVVNSAANAVERQVSRSLSTSYALASILQQTGGKIDNFDKLAAEMLDRYGGIGSLTLMPNGINTQMYPLAGNESAIGHNILTDPLRRSEALQVISSRRLMLAGPYTLKQGGVGAIGRLAVFIEDKQGDEHFWGFVAVVLNVPQLLEAAHASDLTRAGYDYEISKQLPDSSQREIFARSSTVSLSAPEVVSIDVPDGKWFVAVTPTGGWHSWMDFKFHWAGALLVSLLVGFGTYWRLRSEILAEQARQHVDSDRSAAIEKAALIDRLAAVGSLAAGVAHEISQPLQALKVTADTFLYRYDNKGQFDKEGALKNLRVISIYASQIGTIVQEMRSLLISGHRHISLRPIDLNEVIEKLLRVLSSKIAESRIAVDKELMADLPYVMADYIKLEEVVLNLVINASEAMSGVTTEPVIRIRTFVDHFRVVVEVADNGPGVSETVRNQIFDPFFTTKTKKNMGTGLSVARTIITAYHGSLDLVSGSGTGAVFRMELPAID